MKVRKTNIAEMINAIKGKISTMPFKREDYVYGMSKLMAEETRKNIDKYFFLDLYNLIKETKIPSIETYIDMLEYLGFEVIDDESLC